MELSPRRRGILRHIVEEYVVTAQPVASETIARRVRPPVSAATVRNEMAVLESGGFIVQPHTSAGRVPTDYGYRYYVEQLMPGVGPSPREERRILHQFHQVESEMDQWAHLATSVLADAVRAAAVVALPVVTTAKVRRVELVSIHDRMVLVALILQSGSIRQHLQHLSDAIAQEELERLSQQLNAQVVGQTARGVRRAAEHLAEPAATFARTVAQMLEQAERQNFEQIYYEGLSHVLSQPEFAQSAKLRPLVEVLERSQVLGALLADVTTQDGVRVIIGSEHRLEPLRSTAMIVTRYGTGDEVHGVLGVVGPTRLAYWRAIPMVRFIANLMGALLQRTYHA